MSRISNRLHYNDNKPVKALLKALDKAIELDDALQVSVLIHKLKNEHGLKLEVEIEDTKDVNKDDLLQ